MSYTKKNNNEFLFAARDSYVVRRDDNYDECFVRTYYDLYNQCGELLIGGFERYELKDELNLLKIWVNLGNYSGWIVLDQHLRSVIATENGEHYQFQKGYIFTPIVRKRIINSFNYSGEIVAISEQTDEIERRRDDDGEEEEEIMN